MEDDDMLFREMNPEDEYFMGGRDSLHTTSSRLSGKDNKRQPSSDDRSYGLLIIAVFCGIICLGIGLYFWLTR